MFCVARFLTYQCKLATLNPLWDPPFLFSLKSWQTPCRFIFFKEGKKEQRCCFCWKIQTTFIDSCPWTKTCRQEVILLDNEVAFNEAIIEEREQGIRDIEEQIGEANEIFKDLAVLVHDQGVVIGESPIPIRWIFPLCQLLLIDTCGLFCFSLTISNLFLSLQQMIFTQTLILLLLQQRKQEFSYPRLRKPWNLNAHG